MSFMPTRIDQPASIPDNPQHSQRYGFNIKGSVHISRTIMLDALSALIDYVGNPAADKADYINALENENCLGKRSNSNRKNTRRFLLELYALDPSVTIFRSLLYFWQREKAGHALQSLLCAFARDEILRKCAPFVLNHPQGALILPETLKSHLAEKEPGRFSEVTLLTIAQHVNSSLTQTGHLKGKYKKIRARAQVTSGAVSYSLFLGYLNGLRGEALFRSEYAQLLDCSMEHAVELAEDASRKGWIVLKRIGSVIEVLFPSLLTAWEMEWIREQN